MNANIFEKANKIVNLTGEAYIGLIDENGYPSVSTVSSIRTDGIFKAWYSTGLEGNKIKRILADKRASVCYRNGGDNVTLVGTARVLTDEKIKHELWQDWFIDHFPEGRDDPGYCIIEFTTERVSLWVECEGAEFTVKELLKIQSHCGLLCDKCDFREPCNCGKCIETGGNPFHGECPVAGCCIEKNHEHCGECELMPCEQLDTYSCHDKEHGDNPPGARLSVLRYWVKYNQKNIKEKAHG